MATFLPSGILLNTTEVYEEIASYAVLPPEKLRQYWNVYTTTARRLRDPKAYRLENFWWHVWGSDKRFLSGPQLARLFEDFSNRPTFVPLRRPGNRYEGPPIPRHATQRSQPPPPKQSPTEGEASGQRPSPPSAQGSLLGGGSLSGQSSLSAQGSSPGQGSYETVGTSNKLLVPSAFKPAPSHTILKTPRRPSAGARPKARFVSPPDGKTKDGGSTLPDSSETLRYTVSTDALHEAMLPVPAKTLVEPLAPGSTLKQQKQMAEALGITTQVKLVKKIQGMRSPEKNLLQQMHPINSPLLSVPPAGVTPEPKGKGRQAPEQAPQALALTLYAPAPAPSAPALAPHAPTLAPHPLAEASPMRTDIQEQLRQQRAPPGAAQGQKGKAALQAPDGPVKTPQDGEDTQQAGFPEGRTDTGPYQTPAKPKEERPRPRNGSSTQNMSGSASGQRQRGPNREAAQASGSKDQIQSWHVIPEMTDRSQLLTRRRVVPLPVSRRPRFVPPSRKPSRQNSIMSDTSTTSVEPYYGRLSALKPTPRPSEPSPLEDTTSYSLDDVAGPVRTKQVHLQARGPQLFAPPTDPVSQSEGGTGQSPGFQPWVPPPNPLPEVHVPSLSEFFVYPSPNPPPTLSRTNLLPPPSVGSTYTGCPAIRPSPSLRSRSSISSSGSLSSTFAPSLMLARASAETAIVSTMVAQGEIGSENTPTVTIGPRYSSSPPRYQPTAPSTAPPIPFGRTRSQLRVFLDANSDGSGGSGNGTARGRKSSSKDAASKEPGPPKE